MASTSPTIPNSTTTIPPKTSSRPPKFSSSGSHAWRWRATNTPAKSPFEKVYLTGIVRDKLGRKMSKSLGNSPDPLALIEQYGADGVRMGMLMSSPAGNDLPFDEDLCLQGRNFSNKVWNALRLVKGWEAGEGEVDAASALGDDLV